MNGWDLGAIVLVHKLAATVAPEDHGGRTRLPMTPSLPRLSVERHRAGTGKAKFSLKLEAGGATRKSYHLQQKGKY